MVDKVQVEEVVYVKLSTHNPEGQLVWSGDPQQLANKFFDWYQKENMSPYRVLSLGPGNVELLFSIQDKKKVEDWLKQNSSALDENGAH